MLVAGIIIGSVTAACWALWLYEAKFLIPRRNANDARSRALLASIGLGQPWWDFMVFAEKALAAGAVERPDDFVLVTPAPESSYVGDRSLPRDVQGNLRFAGILMVTGADELFGTEAVLYLADSEEARRHVAAGDERRARKVAESAAGRDEAVRIVADALRRVADDGTDLGAVVARALEEVG